MATTATGFQLVDGKYVIDKDPNAELDYVWDLSNLVPDGDLITGVTTATTQGITVVSSSFTAKTVTVWLKLGTKGRQPASCTVSYVTQGGRKDDRTLYFNIVEK